MTTDAEVVVGALEVEEGLNEPEVQEGFETMLVIHCTLLRSKEQHSLHVITVKRTAPSFPSPSVKKLQSPPS
jgi:hypothetical protein